ncbi:MAG: SpoIID/LytB domain-containing protein [Lachnospiraceae bacterium]|nr:SpoIID/LytB domain-containing protein [Lachnospiraceae bacterium]
MRDKIYNITKQKKRAVPKKKWELFGAVLLFMLILPYVYATFMGSVRIYEKKTYVSPIVVARHTDMGIERLPLEEYLIGALAASIDPAYEMEALKAQAVILRTMVHKQYQNRQNKNSDDVDAELLQQEYLTLRQIKEKFGTHFETYYPRLQSAIMETEGCIVQYENIAVDTPYFLLSAGRTRNGMEAFSSADYPHLQSVDSSEDMCSPDYLCVYSYNKNQFMDKIEELVSAYGMEDYDTGAMNVDQIKLVRDSSDYVREVQLGTWQIQGEYFRRFFNLNSACFAIEEKTDTVEITTKGIGHGVGMSQYGANIMAKAGNNYTTILQHYFTNIQIQRN